MNLDKPGLPAVALIAGPTASGKSALALALARALRDAGRDAVIVNADASSVYRDIPILSAAPSAADRAEIPHVLVGHVDAAENCNVARWCAEAAAAIDAAHAGGAVPILVGGTGLYLKALLHGLAPVPAIDPASRERARALPAAEAHALLARLDPAGAAGLRPSDTARTQRALEVLLSTGRPLRDWQARTSGGIAHRIALHPLLLLPPRDWLRARCDARFAAMLDTGAVAEVRALLARRLDPMLPALRAIGVPQLAAYLEGRFGLDVAVAQAQAATRQLAKRQYTFFTGQFDTDWPRVITPINDVALDLHAILLRSALLT